MSFPYQYSTLRHTPYILNYIYEGQVYVSYHEFTGVASGTSVYIEVRVGSRIHHTISRSVNVKGSSDVLVSIWENATFTPGTTDVNMPPVGVDRRVGALNNPTTRYLTNPTGVSTASATLIARDKIYASGIGANAIGESTLSDFERILKPNTSYIVQFTPVGATTDMTYRVMHYESGN